MSDLKERIRKHIAASEALTTEIEEYQNQPDPVLIGGKDVLVGVGKLMRTGGLIVKLTPYAWLGWILTGGGMFLEAIGKGKDVYHD